MLHELGSGRSRISVQKGPRATSLCLEAAFVEQAHFAQIMVLFKLKSIREEGLITALPTSTLPFNAFMRSRSLAFMLTMVCECPLKSGARRGLGIPKYSLTSAHKGPITSLIRRTMFLVMHPNIKLAFIYLFIYFFAAVVYCKFSFDSNANYLIFGMLNHLSFKLFMWCSVYLHPNYRSLHLFFITDSYRTNKRPALITILLISDSEKQCFPDPPGFESHQ